MCIYKTLKAGQLPQEHFSFLQTLVLQNIWKTGWCWLECLCRWTQSLWYHYNWRYKDLSISCDQKVMTLLPRWLPPMEKSLELSRLKFLGKLFVSESMCFENHQLAYKCRKLKNLGKIHSTWFYNNVVNIKLTENGRIYRIFHIIDIEKLLDIDNLNELLCRKLFLHNICVCMYVYVYIIFNIYLFLNLV